MRLRNIPGSREFIEENEFAIKDPETHFGNWRQLFNKDITSQLHIEIGMGKGQFISTLAANNPDISYIGIEKFSSVLFRALEKRPLLETDNLYFLRFDAENITSIFSQGEIDRIYLNFSDPWPKDRHAKRRLTSIQFLERYKTILSPDGDIMFKTDNKDLFDFSLEQAKLAKWNILEYTYDLHNNAKMNEGNIMTEYEERFSSMGTPICKMIIKPN